MRNRLMKSFRITFVLLMGLAGSLVRAQSAYGPGGLFMIPSAYTSSEGQSNLGMMGGKEGMWGPHGAHDHLWLSTAVAYGASDRLQVGFTQIALQNTAAKPTWGAFAKYQLRPEEGNRPAIAVSGVWLPVWHWRTEAVALSASKSFELTDSVRGHIHAGALHARFFNGIKTDHHPYAPEAGHPVSPLFDPSRPIVRQVPFVGVDVAVGKWVKLTAEGRTRLIADHPDAIPAKVGIIFTLPGNGRLGFAWGSDGLDSENALTIGVGYNISTVD